MGRAKTGSLRGRGNRHLLSLQTVLSAIHAASDSAAGTIKTECQNSIEDFILEHPMESPIEAVFAAWWRAREITDHICGDHPNLQPQHSVEANGKSYRLDFVVWHTDVDTLWEAQKAGFLLPKIAVELDGHDFHERTLQQVAYRKQRDRDLQIAGWSVFHFSGSELIKSPEECVAQVFDVASLAYSLARHELWKIKRAQDIATAG